MIEIIEAELAAEPQHSFAIHSRRPIAEPHDRRPTDPPSRAGCRTARRAGRRAAAGRRNFDAGRGRAAAQRRSGRSTGCWPAKQRQRELLPKFMAVAVACFAIYGVVMTGVLNGFVWHGDYWLPHLPPARVGHWSMGNLTAAYTLGLIAANGICLPSFYFYGLLAGLRTTMLAIAAQAIKAMASGGLALVGSAARLFGPGADRAWSLRRKTAYLDIAGSTLSACCCRLWPDCAERPVCTPAWPDWPPR